MTSTTELENKLNNICLENNNNSSNSQQENCLNNTKKSEEKWGMELKELYRLALNFYKDKSGKAVHLSYEDNLKLIAYTQQAIHGTFDSKTAPPLGVLDVIGRDRRLAWQNLGPISKLQAMEGFINLLDRLCPSFRPYIEAIKKDKEERLKKELEERRKQQEALDRENKLREEQKQLEEQRNREEIQKRQLQDALNQQTYHQFKAYAKKQFPGNPEQQAVLIKQLQTEHYHQYMQQLHAQIKTNTKITELTATTEIPNDYQQQEQQHQQQISSNSNELLQTNEEQKISGNNSVGGDSDVNNDENKDIKDQCESGDESGEYLVISPAKMWTRPNIKVFKQEVSAGAGDGVIHVGHGDTVTVRVPTHEDGNCIFWEFATDNYDIGFGVYFEWGKSLTNDVTVHVSESDDEDELYEDDDDEYTQTGDLECGPVQTINQNPTNNIIRPPISIIVPVYRRECHNEVYVGSHNYPGEGVYLLKFDNSFSIWRSKTLYYRVYYERKMT